MVIGSETKENDTTRPSDSRSGQNRDMSKASGNSDMFVDLVIFIPVRA
jgi:hypothetical protein